MAVIVTYLIEELWEDREGTPFSVSSEGTGERTYTRRFLVRSDIMDVGSIIVCSTPGLPLPFSPYMTYNGTEYDLLALCTKLSAKQRDKDDWQYWVVTAEYSTTMPGGGPVTEDNTGAAANAADFPGKDGGAQNNPDLEPPELEYDFETVQRAFRQDRQGKLFTSSAGQPYIPAPTFEVSYPVLVLTRNELRYDPQKAAGYAHAVNSDVFLGMAKGTCQCMPPKAKRQYRGTKSYWRVTYRIKIGVPLADGTFLRWQPEILDEGTMVRRARKDPADGVVKMMLVPIYRDGAQVTSPIPFNGDGEPAELENVGDVGEDGNAGAAWRITPVTRVAEVYPTRSFVDLLVRGLG